MPKCSKCVKKNISCRYPLNSNPSPQSENQQGRPENGAETATSEAPNFSNISTTGIPQCTVESCSEPLNDTTNVSAIPDPGSEIYDWDLSNIGSTDCLPFNDAHITSPTTFDVPSALETVDTTPLHDFATEVRLMTYAPMVASANARIPRSLPFNLRSMWVRPKLKSGAQVTANHMARILNAYPKMMLNCDTLPPFVHPQWISACESETFLEPLANCMSLLGMFTAGVRGTASLFWRNVRMECDRLLSIRHTLTKHGILATLQALLLYLLVRIAEGETEHNNHDAALLGTITMMLSSMTTQLGCEMLQLVNWENSWSDWIFEESRRRLSTVFRILNMLVCVEPATPCSMQPGLLLAPLPARKQLWEAGGEEQWMNQVRKTPSMNTGFGLAMNGDLLALDEYQMKLLSMQSVEPWTGSSSKEIWDEWSAGMDGLGTLVMLAASLAI